MGWGGKGMKEDSEFRKEMGEIEKAEQFMEVMLITQPQSALLVRNF